MDLFVHLCRVGHADHFVFVEKRPRASEAVQQRDKVRYRLLSSVWRVPLAAETETTQGLHHLFEEAAFYFPLTPSRELLIFPLKLDFWIFG